MNSVFSRKLLKTKGICLSVLLPTYKLSPERMQNVEIVRKAIARSKNLLANNPLSAPHAHTMTDALESLVKRFDPIHSGKGLGLFVSDSGIAEIVLFPFPVQERIIIDQSFETRDLLYLEQYLAPFHLIVLTRNSLRLFERRADDFVEIENERFPFEFEDEYEYARPSIGTSFGYARKGYEKDKSMMRKTRLQRMFEETVPHLKAFFAKAPDYPLLVAGTREHVSQFSALKEVEGRVSEFVIGTFDDDNLQQLRTRAEAAFLSYQETEIDHMISQLREKDGNGRVAKGIQEVWEAAQTDKGLRLLVERDYAVPSYRVRGNPTLHLHVPSKPYTVVPDAVDEIIEQVVRKRGTVVFASPGQLHDFFHIAMELRYS